MMHDRDDGAKPTPHLGPALMAVLLAGVFLVALDVYARSLEARSIGALAADEAIIDPNGILYRLKNQGTALQEAALEAGSLLPLYGSSELNMIVPYDRPFHVFNLFRDHPTGFAVFPVGKQAATCLIIQQKLAAVAASLRGRKVAISVSPFWFFDTLTAWDGGYAGNFSALHAGELAFNTRLSLRLRQDAARRMLQYPATLTDRPLLRFALENLAEGSPVGLALYGAVLPLGVVQNTILRYQDHWNVVRYLWRHPARPWSPPPAPRGGHPLDWSAWHRRAEAVYRTHSDNNEFGLDNHRWDRKLREMTLQAKGSLTDEEFLGTLRANQEWVDLELLLRELNELGARTLVVSMPIHGPWYDRAGVTYAARRAYYQRLREVGARHRAEVVDFADHDADRAFCFDHRGHLGPGGWVSYGQALDGFFHGTTPSPPDLLDPAAGTGGKGSPGVFASPDVRASTAR